MNKHVAFSKSIVAIGLLFLVIFQKENSYSTSLPKYLIKSNFDVDYQSFTFGTCCTGRDYSSSFVDQRNFIRVHITEAHRINIVCYEYLKGYLKFDGTFKIQNDMIIARVKVDYSEMYVDNLSNNKYFGKVVYMNGVKQLISDYIELRFVMVKCFPSKCEDVIEYSGKGKVYKHGLYLSDNLYFIVYNRTSASSTGFNISPIRRGVYVPKNPIYP